jgi:hypothetical protein
MMAVSKIRVVDESTFRIVLLLLFAGAFEAPRRYTAMSPKKMPSRPKPTLPKAEEKPAKSNKKHVKTLLEEHEDEQVALLPELEKADGAKELEVVAARAIRDNFRTWSVETTHMKLVEGKTMIERILSDKRNGKSTGKKYYEMLRELYMYDCHPTKRLRIRDEAEALLPELEAVVLGLLKAKRDQRPMEDFFLNGPMVPNQRSAVGLIRQMLKIPALSPTMNFNLWLGFLKCFAKYDLKDQYPDEFTSVKTIFDAVLTKSCWGYKSANLSAKLRWEAHGHIGGLLIPSSDMDDCVNLKHGESWETCDLSWRVL